MGASQLREPIIELRFNEAEKQALMDEFPRRRPR